MAAGAYPTNDGRIVDLHAGFPHNTRALLELLDVPEEHDAVTAAVARRSDLELQDAIANAGLCGAMVREAAEWDTSAPGIALAARPFVDLKTRSGRDTLRRLIDARPTCFCRAVVAAHSNGSASA